MSRIKYHFNPQSLKYEKVIVGVRKKVLVVIGWIATAMVFGVVSVWFAYNYFDSPKERQLRAELEEMQVQYDLLKKRIESAELVLNDLQLRDDNVYRVIFEANPIPASVRQAGYGGVYRYKQFENFNNGELMKSLSLKVDKLEKQIYIQSKSLDEVFVLAKNKTEMLASIPGIQPVSNKSLTAIASGFGYRIHPIYKTSMMHEGLDFTAPVGTKIYATGNCTVKEIELHGRGYGHNVLLSHGYGYETRYAHLSKILVRAGQKLKRGDVIGLVGNTGSSTGPHLHYEVIKSGKKINPVNFFFNDLTPEEYQKVIELSSQSNQALD